MFSSVNIEDHRVMKRMTEATVRDNAGKCSYCCFIITMLTSSFTAVRSPSLLVGIVAQTDILAETNFVPDYDFRPRNVCVCKLARFHW